MDPLTANRYSWTSKDGITTQISLSPNLDNLIHQSKNDESIRGAVLLDCGIVYAMPSIMRYCFENQVNLRKRKFIRNLPAYDPEELDLQRTECYFKMPLRGDAGIVRSVLGRLELRSSPQKYRPSGRVCFQPGDVPRLVEGLIRVLDWDGIRGAQIKCIQTVQHYHHCLDKGILN